MSDPKWVQKELDRLRGLDYFPKDNTSAIDDLRDALRSSKSDAVVTTVVNWWVRDHREAPKPVDLWRAVSSENDRYDADHMEFNPPPTRCEWCDNTGFEIVRGRDRNTGFEITGARICRHKTEGYIAPSTVRNPYCGHCRGYGIIESIDASKVESVASWCSCANGKARQEEEPDWVDRVNRARKVLMKREADYKKDPKRLKPVAKVPVEEPYYGEF